MLGKIAKNKLFIAGVAIIAPIAFLSIFAPLFCKYNPTDINIENALLAPSWQHLMGTDSLGRDLFARMLYGGRVSLSVGFVAVGISVFIGVLLGAIAGFYGGWVDEAIMRFVDMMLCFPSFFLILTLAALSKPSIYLIMFIIGITSWMGPARLIRAEVLSLKEQNFILAAKSLGLPQSRIIFRHLIPNAIGPVLVNATLGIAAAILVESSLSFLGLGVQPPMPSWGNILTEAKSTLDVAWWITLFPGAAIFLTVLGFNLIGEAVRDNL